MKLFRFCFRLAGDRLLGETRSGGGETRSAFLYEGEVCSGFFGGMFGPRFAAILLVFALGVTAAVAQTSSKSKKPDTPSAKVTEVAKLKDGGLLFAVRVFASSSQPLKLMRAAPEPAPGVRRMPGDADPRPFSLAASTLKDIYSGKVYSALGSVPGGPGKPYFGPIQTTATLAPGGWTQLGVAFPPVPPPPPDKKGNPQPYQLLFSVPELKIEARVSLDPKTLKPTMVTQGSEGS